MVQITLTGNKISTTGGNQLVADLTGDGRADISVEGVVWSAGVGAEVNRNRLLAQFVGPSNKFSVDARFAYYGVGAASEFSIGLPVMTTYLNPITFTDTQINGGLPTEAWLEVNAFNTSAVSHTVELARLIFDTKSTTRPVFGSVPVGLNEWVAAVPEPGSNLALLALGAGGLTLRRRLKRAA